MTTLQHTTHDTHTRDTQALQSMGALIADARIRKVTEKASPGGCSSVGQPPVESTQAAAVTRYLVTRMAVLSVSYLGWPVHVLASVLWYLSSQLLNRAQRRLKQLLAGKPMLVAGGVGKELPAAGGSKGALTRFFIRLKNLPQSDEYFVNKRGRTIHVRSYMPTDPNAIRAVVIFSHGYGAHCNSPRKHQMGLAMPKQGLAMYQMDLEGHGYSEGERAYIDHYNNWVEDFRQLLELVAGDGGRAHSPEDGAAAETLHHFDATEAQRRRLQEVPIFIAGESLGGALSILLGLHLQETNHPLLPRFKGEVLLAPAIKGNPPPAMLVLALRYLIAPLIPRWQIPSCLESVNRSDMCVLELDERRLAEHDVLGYPGGLGWGGNMRFRTGLNLIDLTTEVSRRLDHVAFPFLIMHDPGDNIVQYDSSRELTFRASTPEGSPRGRELRAMEGWLHCLLTNCPEITIRHLSDWILYQTTLCEQKAIVARQQGLNSAGMIDPRRLLGAKILSPAFQGNSSTPDEEGVSHDDNNRGQHRANSAEGLNNNKLAATMTGLTRARRASQNRGGSAVRRSLPIVDAIIHRRANWERSTENAARAVPARDLLIDSPSRGLAASHNSVRRSSSDSVNSPGLTPVASAPNLALASGGDGSAASPGGEDSVLFPGHGAEAFRFSRRGRVSSVSTLPVMWGSDAGTSTEYPRFENASSVPGEGEYSAPADGVSVLLPSGDETRQLLG